jgi:hypothetical protein
MCLTDIENIIGYRMNICNIKFGLEGKQDVQHNADIIVRTEGTGCMVHS